MADYYDDFDFVINEHDALEEYDGDGGKIVIPKGVRRIEHDAFFGNETITSVKLPKSVKVIAAGAFEGCRGLADKAGFVIIQDVIYDYFGAASYLTVPDKIVHISERAFNNSSNIITLTIPDGVQTIGAFAFCGCAYMVSIELPSTITSIGNNAFMLCEKLQHVTYAGNRAEWEQLNESTKLCLQARVEIVCADD